MKALIEAIILGIVQGLTEFLPVSSSGHLELVKALFNSDRIGKESMMMTVTLHVATALSTIVIFRKDIGKILRGIARKEGQEERNFSIKIILSMIPASIVGVLFDEQIESFFDGNILLVGCTLLVTGGLLFLAEKAKNTSRDVSFSHAIMIGISQMIAILPGISRSGATISTAVLLGIDKEKAARFSFLMVVPLILGKVAKDMLDIFSGEEVIYIDHIGPLMVGFVMAFATGIAACKWMIGIVKNSKLHYFAYYCFIVGALALIASFF